MPTFLVIAARKRLVEDAYTDDAAGVLEKSAEGKMAVTRITLRPQIKFAEGTEPSEEELAKLHEKAHEHCFIANSVRKEISVEGG